MLERAALAVIGPTDLPGVRPGPAGIAAERAAWLAAVQAMREAALDIAFLADARRRSTAAAGTRARTARRIRVGFTSAEAVLLQYSARVCTTTVGRFVAAAAEHYAAALDPYTMAAHHARLAAAVAVLQQERDHWADGLRGGLPGRRRPPAGPRPAPPHLQGAASGLTAYLRGPGDLDRPAAPRGCGSHHVQPRVVAGSASLRPSVLAARCTAADRADPTTA